MNEIKKYLACEGRVNIICAETTELVEEARKIHDLSPVATAALGGAQIAKIKNTKFGDSGSAGAVSSGAVNSMIIPPVQYTQAVQGASTEGAIKDTKVYVTETDIKDTMNKVDVQESENTY